MCSGLDILCALLCIGYAQVHWNLVQYIYALVFCLVSFNRCFQGISEYRGVWDTIISQHPIISFEASTQSEFAMWQTGLCVVALIVSHACWSDIFHFDARCSGVGQSTVLLLLT